MAIYFCIAAMMLTTIGFLVNELNTRRRDGFAESKDTKPELPYYARMAKLA